MNKAMAQSLGWRHSDDAVRGAAAPEEEEEEDVSYRTFGRSGLRVSQQFHVAVGGAAP